MFCQVLFNVTGVESNTQIVLMTLFKRFLLKPFEIEKYLCRKKLCSKKKEHKQGEGRSTVNAEVVFQHVTGFVYV